MLVQDADGEIESFIARWSASGGAERSNFQLFAVELCRLLDVDEPRPARENINRNDYTFERSVEFKGPDGSTSPGRIDLYKRGCFVMEAKQSRERGRPKAVVVKGQPDFFRPEVHPRGKASAHRAWDVLMLNARRQAEDYARALPTSHGWPPFVIVCDVGHCFEVFADFSGQGKNYAQFPDRQGYRIHLEDLRKPEVRTFLAAVWREPHGLDPARQSAKVTREIAERLAKVSKALEERGYKTEDVAWFLMRCLFTMFAEDVNLLPRDGFKNLLTRCRDNTKMFAPMTEQLWKVMNTGGFAYAIEQHVLHFNGHFFDKATAMPLRREDIGELLAAAKADWRQVEPAIFGTLLEQALTETERARLGAHYTPRAYVERLVVATVIEPLRQEWAEVQATAERLKEEQRTKDAIAGIRAFHDKLCTTRVLDPACGTGNFLYLALELMKKLEGEVLDALVALGGQEVLALEKQTIGPNQFLGLEVNPRAAAIAELVVWLGYLQWHFRTQGGAPSEPILRDFGNVAAMDAVLDWTGHPVSKIALREDGSRVETYPNARRPDWPEAEFIVGNPPFIGGKDIRAQLGSSYAETLWRVHDHINESADLVMYWWDRAADILTAKASKLRRFGFVTTNSITQTFSRRVVARHLESKRPLSLAMAVPDHPWTKATPDHAAVRIAMTVAERGKRKGVLCEIIHEAGIDTDRPRIEMTERRGRINADLTVGADATQARALKANEGLCSPGVKLHGTGFIVTPNEARHLGLGKRRGLD
ncbi:MAG: DNA methyltransferase, partial [Hyphomicrobiaceae bacterium]